MVVCGIRCQCHDRWIEKKLKSYCGASNSVLPFLFLWMVFQFRKPEFQLPRLYSSYGLILDLACPASMMVSFGHRLQSKELVPYDIPDQKSLRSIPVISIKVDCYIDVNDITIFERSTERRRHQNWSSWPRKYKYYSSGMPCTTMLFTLVQQERGNPAYNNGEGYAEWDMMRSCTAASIELVVTPA